MEIILGISLCVNALSLAIICRAISISNSERKKYYLHIDDQISKIYTALKSTNSLILFVHSKTMQIEKKIQETEIRGLH